MASADHVGTTDDALDLEPLRGGTKACDDATLATDRGSCDNGDCPCENCPCGKGCRCTPLSVPRVITTGGAAAVGAGEGVQFAVAVRGMTCGGCASAVTNAIAASTPEFLDVRVDLATARALVMLAVDAVDRALTAAVQSVLDAIEDVGFEAELDVASFPKDVPSDLFAPKSATQTTRENDECGICLETLEKPITLPCGHTFSAKCLDGWRSRYDVRQVTHKTCPLCREAMPPSKEMVSQLASWRRALQSFEQEGDVHGADYRLARSKVEELEAVIGSCAEIMESAAGDECIELPGYVTRAAMENDVERVLRWTGPVPDAHCTCGGNCREAYRRRLDARDPAMMSLTLLHAAAANGHVGLATLLLQRGASVDPVDANGQSPLAVRSVLDGADADGTVPLLLQWGAAVPAAPAARRAAARAAARCGNARVAALLASDLGGRRCALAGADAPGGAGRDGAPCVAGRYRAGRDAYEVVLERTGEALLVGPRRLRRRDRTPEDPGYYVTFERGRFARRDFASGEACRAFVAARSAAGDAGPPAEDLLREAEARADAAAAALLSELSLEGSSPAVKSSKGPKNKKKKKGKKKKA